jgi:hypothetical protein
VGTSGGEGCEGFSGIVGTGSSGRVEGVLGIPISGTSGFLGCGTSSDLLCDFINYLQ